MWKKVHYQAHTEWLRWVTDTRMILLPAFFVFLYDALLRPLLEASYDMASPLHLLEPFIALTNSQLIVLLMPCVFLALISDFPRMDGSSILALPRTGRRAWVLGQALFLFRCALLFLTSVLAASCLLCAHRSYWGAGWSRVTREYALVFPERSGSLAANLIRSNLYYQLRTAEAALHSFLLLLLYFLFLGMILLTLCLLRQRRFGMVCAAGVLVAGQALTVFQTKSSWLFPAAHSIVQNHFTLLYSRPIVPLAVSYLYFGVGILVMLGLSLYLVKDFPYDAVMEATE